MPKILKTLVKKKKPVRVNTNFKFSPEVRKVLNEKASMYCNGNKTALIEAALVAYVPKKSDLVDLW